jgi:predicted nucleic acid-binding protein
MRCSSDDILTMVPVDRLTTCDAAYLELAVRRGLQLPTKDQDLGGVEVLP